MTETLQRWHSPAGHTLHAPVSRPGAAASLAPSVAAAGLTTARGAALYIGALLGPGLLLLPGLAAA
jgi:amino acid efflux transporter